MLKVPDLSDCDLKPYVSRRTPIVNNADPGWKQGKFSPLGGRGRSLSRKEVEEIERRAKERREERLRLEGRGVGGGGEHGTRVEA